MSETSERPTVAPAATKSTWSAERAQQRLARHVAQFSDLAGTQITHMHQLDIGSEWYAFSVLPPVGIAGEVVYLLGRDRMLSSGRANDFDQLLRELDIARDPGCLDAATFGNLFIRFRIHARGYVLTDQHDPVLELAPELRSGGAFSPPQRVQDGGARYRFWIWDATQFKPLFFNVSVAADGTTSF